jgi:hypothetical protein
MQGRRNQLDTLDETKNEKSHEQVTPLLLELGEPLKETKPRLIPGHEGEEQVEVGSPPPLVVVLTGEAVTPQSVGRTRF